MHQHTVNLSDGSRITVTRTGTLDSDGESDPRYRTSRRRYSYIVRDSDGGIVTRGRDLHGPVYLMGSPCPSARTMAGTLLAFLHAAGEHYAYQGMPDEEGYEAHFAATADEWCYMHSEELWDAREEIEGERS